MRKNDVADFSKKPVTQVITCTSGVKMTFKGVKPETIAQGIMTHFETVDGRMVIINTANVFTVEVIR